MIRLMGMESTHMIMEPHMKETGSKTNKKASAKKPGQMALNTKASMKMAESTAKEHSTSLTEASTKANSKTTKSQEWDSTLGTTARSTMAAGRTTKCTGRGFSNGLTRRLMKESSKMISDTALEYSSGKTARFMKGHGLKESSMESGFL